LKTVFGDDWTEKLKVIFAGDDVTDEDAMTALKGVAFSFRITKDSNTNTVANKILPCTTSVLDLLKWVEDYLIKR
jgi:trehalose 6-phosphate synthase/phosphatase